MTLPVWDIFRVGHLQTGNFVVHHQAAATWMNSDDLVDTSLVLSAKSDRWPEQLPKLSGKAEADWLDEGRSGISSLLQIILAVVWSACQPSISEMIW